MIAAVALADSQLEGDAEQRGVKEKEAMAQQLVAMEQRLVAAEERMITAEAAAAQQVAALERRLQWRRRQ